MTDAGTSIGQVVEARTDRFVVELYEDAAPPALGDVVAAGEGGGQSYGVVFAIETGGIDGTRRPQARPRGEEGHARVVEANPHLRHLLRTTCQALVVAHRREGTIHPYLPPSPPRIWDPVTPCTTVDRDALMAEFDALAPLVAGGAQYDDTTAALIRALATGTADARAYRVGAGKALANLLAADPPRLTALLRRIRP